MTITLHHQSGEMTLEGALRETTEEMANRASVDMDLWQRHSRAALDAADEIERLRMKMDQASRDARQAMEILEGVRSCQRDEDGERVRVVHLRLYQIEKALKGDLSVRDERNAG